MTDLISRLRGFIECDGGDMADIAEAADEIERLREFLAAERDRIFVLAARNERLRLALREAMYQATEYDGLDATQIGPRHWYSLAFEALKETP